MSKMSRFAGLMGGLLSGKTATEDGKDKDQSAEKPVKREDESDEDFEERLKKWREEGGEEEAETPDDVTDTTETDDGKVKKAKEDGVAEGVTAERNRWSTVLASPAAAGKAITACSLLADTDMTAANIQKTLAALPAEGGRSTLAQRTGNKPTPAPAVDGGKSAAEPGSPAAFATEVAAARELARPSKKAS